MPPAPVLPRHCTFAAPDWAVLAAHWHPVAVAADVADRPVAARLLDQDLVLYRTAAGITVAADLCAHRGAPLSMGKLRDDRIVCAYHGYCYDGTGRCALVPAHPEGPIPGKLHLRLFASVERSGLVWVRLMEGAAAEIPAFPEYVLAGFQQITVPPFTLAASA